jgi:hypothetical protein
VNPIRTAFVVTIVALAAISAHGQQTPAPKSTFTVVNNPSGGQYIYGPLPGRGSMPDAVVYVLQQVHAYFGNRPDVGKFFGSRDGRSMATFFTVGAKNLDDKLMTGLLIVARGADGSASGAVLFDEQRRFASTEPQLMKALSAVWQPIAGDTPGAAGSAAPQGTGPPLHARGPAPLTQVSGGDQSAAISLPAGWKITSVASGTLTAAGSNGEMIFLGLLYQGFLMGPDLFTNFVNISNQFRGQHGLPPGTYTGINKTNLSPQAVQVTFHVDFNDGVGPRRGSVRLDSWGPKAMAVNGSNIPERFADEESPTMNAVIASFRQNEQMMAQLRQGAMNRVQNDIARGRAQNDAINARREASNAAFNQHMSNLDAQSSANDAHNDNIDRSSKVFQDYVLDRSVVRDTENGERGTVTNSYADSLVRGNPDRFQLVPNQDLIRGKDY